MAYRWLDRANTLNGTVGERLAEASEAVVASLRDANEVVARQGSAGLDYAREIGDEVLTSVRRAGRSTRGLIAERPVESAVILALVGVAVGWVWRRMREGRAEDVGVAAPTRSRTGTARRKRTVAQ